MRSHVHICFISWENTTHPKSQTQKFTKYVGWNLISLNTKSILFHAAHNVQGPTRLLYFYVQRYNKNKSDNIVKHEAVLMDFNLRTTQQAKMWAVFVYTTLNFNPTLNIYLVHN